MSMSRSAEVYDSIAEDYAVSTTNFTFRNSFMLPAFWSTVGDVKGRTILDLACGTGPISHEFVKKGAQQVIGVDVSEAMVTLAQEKFQHPKLEFKVGNAMSFSAGKEFDLVTCVHLFTYAATRECLDQFCQNAFRHAAHPAVSVECGGRRVARGAVRRCTVWRVARCASRAITC